MKPYIAVQLFDKPAPFLFSNSKGWISGKFTWIAFIIGYFYVVLGLTKYPKQPMFYFGRIRTSIHNENVGM